MLSEGDVLHSIHDEYRSLGKVVTLYIFIILCFLQSMEILVICYYT